MNTKIPSPHVIKDDLIAIIKSAPGISTEEIRKNLLRHYRIKENDRDAKDTLKEKARDNLESLSNKNPNGPRVFCKNYDAFDVEIIKSNTDAQIRRKRWYVEDVPGQNGPGIFSPKGAAGLSPFGGEIYMNWKEGNVSVEVKDGRYIGQYNNSNFVIHFMVGIKIFHILITRNLLYQTEIDTVSLIVGAKGVKYMNEGATIELMRKHGDNSILLKVPTTHISSFNNGEGQFVLTLAFRNNSKSCSIKTLGGNKRSTSYAMLNIESSQEIINELGLKTKTKNISQICNTPYINIDNKISNIEGPLAIGIENGIEEFIIN
jgi:hypothetical protein